MSRHFCCCIPVRFGVFVLTLLSFLSAGFGAVVLWAAVHLIVTDQLDKVEKTLDDEQKRAFDALMHQSKWIFIVAAILTTIVALFSFFGFVGSVIRNRRMVKAYSVMTVISFILSTISTGFTLYVVWRNKPFCTTIDNNTSCISSTLNKGGKIGFTVGYLFVWFIELYIVVIIRRYVEQLEEEREYRHEFRLNPTTGGTYEAKEGLLTQGHYPYSDSSNAFGANKAPQHV
ncbi:hypothetical protein C8Q74DRAFT_1284728 [Fomes fomentarius]|nr:hypothetical protein C8Q74DRAFT_1284728 [Fomes fomentarius]